jgi:hypothetical protein
MIVPSEDELQKKRFLLTNRSFSHEPLNLALRVLDLAEDVTGPTA